MHYTIIPQKAQFVSKYFQPTLKCITASKIKCKARI